MKKKIGKSTEALRQESFANTIGLLAAIHLGNELIKKVMKSNNIIRLKKSTKFKLMAYIWKSKGMSKDLTITEMLEDIDIEVKE